MAYSRLLLVPVVACSTLFLSGSISLVGPSARSLPEVPPEPTSAAQSPGSANSLATAPDTEAGAALDRAVALLDPDRVVWLRMNLWQRVLVEGMAFESEGRYVAGPGRCFRLELHTCRAGSLRTIEVVSDGSSLWQAARLGQGEWIERSQVRLKDVFAVLDRSEMPARVRDEFLQGQTCSGLPSLLPSLRRRMNWVRKQSVRRDGRLLIKLWGTWTEADAAALVGRGKPWPDHLARQCRLYLDPDSSWPCRLEWWGPDAERGAEAPLVELEFRDPVLNQALPAEECARAFHPDAGAGTMPDRTADVTQRLKARAQQLRAAAARP
jgi:hypothetical protein